MVFVRIVAPPFPKEGCWVCYIVTILKGVFEPMGRIGSEQDAAGDLQAAFWREASVRRIKGLIGGLSCGGVALGLIARHD
jgi:hypothetical protein